MADKRQIYRDRLGRLLGPGNYRRIARGAGLTHQHVSRVLRGQRGASLAAASRIADAAGVTLDDLRFYLEDLPLARAA
jgi:transcriptional regulator with XRE-family HTH domain